VSAVTGMTQQVTQSMSLLAVFVLVGGIGRLVFVAYGDKLTGVNPFRNLSGPALLLAGAVIILGPMFFSSKLNRIWVNIKSYTAEPFITQLLDRDSCTITDTSYCVVIFEGEQEIVVNWYNRGVYLWGVLNPEGGAVWDAPRPPRRPETAAT